MDALPPPPPPIEYSMEASERNEYQTPEELQIPSLDDILVTQTSIDEVVDSQPSLSSSSLPPVNFLIPRDRFGVRFSMRNDNRLLTNQSFVPFIENDGDDYGFTHGEEIAFFMPLSADWFFTTFLRMNLYSRKQSSWKTDNGTKMASQDFMNELIVGITLDDLASDSRLHSIVDAGYRLLNNDSTDGIFDASLYQTLWHEFLSQYNPHVSIPVHVPDTHRVGVPYVGYHLDADVFSLTRLPFAIDVNARVGGVLLPLENGSYADIAGRISVGYQREPGTFAVFLTGETELDIYQTGVRPSYSLSFGFGTNRFAFESSIYQPFGNSEPVVLYDDRNGDHFDREYGLSLTLYLD